MKTTTKPKLTTTKTLRITVPAGMHAKLAAVAALHELSVPDYVRLLIDVELERMSDPNELALHLRDREESGDPELPAAVMRDYLAAFRPGTPENPGADSLN